MTVQPGSDPVGLLEEIHRLMHLRGDNPFKARAYERAAQGIAGREDLVELARAGKLTEIDGVGKSIAEVLTEYLLHGTSHQRDEIARELPEGLAELTSISGVGPKKAMTLIEELGIRSVGELEYACRENRLLKLSGFGDKLQKKILDGIQFHKANSNKLRLSDALLLSERVLGRLRAQAEGLRVSETGELRRKLETLTALEFLVELPENGAGQALRARLEQAATALDGTRIPIRLHFARSAVYGSELARTTGSAQHWAALGAALGSVEKLAAIAVSEESAFYSALGLPEIPPEARETGEEVALARAGALGKLLPWDGIRGVFHNHTTRSDGTATLEQMVVAAQKLGYAYIGISDHSQSAAYAQGLRSEALLEQEREVRAVQEKHPDIRVFWGIESDILADGSLDYTEAELKRFDFVIASVHSRFQMDRETMTQRILGALRNPATRFLGHATGRLLLGRPAYDVDMPLIIATAADHGVAIEINANPARLDIDWRWGTELRRRGTRVSVNPDAHEIGGLEDVRYGVAMARKALMPTDAVVNAGSVAEVERWLRRA